MHVSINGQPQLGQNQKQYAPPPPRRLLFGRTNQLLALACLAFLQGDAYPGGRVDRDGPGGQRR